MPFPPLHLTSVFMNIDCPLTLNPDLHVPLDSLGSQVVCGPTLILSIVVQHQPIELQLLAETQELDVVWEWLSVSSLPVDIRSWAEIQFIKMLRIIQIG